MSDILLWNNGAWTERDRTSWSDRLSDPDHIILAEGTAEWFDFCIKNNLFDSSENKNA